LKAFIYDEKTASRPLFLKIFTGVTARDSTFVDYTDGLELEGELFSDINSIS